MNMPTLTFVISCIYTMFAFCPVSVPSNDIANDTSRRQGPVMMHFLFVTGLLELDDVTGKMDYSESIPGQGFRRRTLTKEKLLSQSFRRRKPTKEKSISFSDRTFNRDASKDSLQRINIPSLEKHRKTFLKPSVKGHFKSVLRRANHANRKNVIKEKQGRDNGTYHLYYRVKSANMLGGRHRREATDDFKDDMYNNITNISSIGAYNYTMSDGFVLTLDASCHRQCGSYQVAPCSCDVTCFVYKTCCEDVATTCPMLEQEARAIMGDQLLDTEGHVTCEASNPVFKVSNCPDLSIANPLHPSDDFVTAVKKLTPVFDSVTGLLFKNKDTFDCYNNNQSSMLTGRLKHWKASFKFDRKIFAETNSPSEFTSFLDPMTAIFTPGDFVEESHECNPTLTNSCYSELFAMDPMDLCGRFISYVAPPQKRTTLTNIYANRFCYYCNVNQTDGMSITKLSSEWRHTLNFAMIMDFNDDNSYMVTIKSPRPVIWDTLSCHGDNSTITSGMKSSSKCRTLKCGLGVLVDGQCLFDTPLFVSLRHPPSPFGVLDIFELVNVMTCYMEMLSWIKDLNMTVKSFDVSDIDIHEDTVQLKSEKDRFASFFKVTMVLRRKSLWNFGSKLIAAFRDMIPYFYMIKDLVQATDDGFLVFKEYASLYNRTKYSFYILTGRIIPNRPTDSSAVPFTLKLNLSNHAIVKGCMPSLSSASTKTFSYYVSAINFATLIVSLQSV